MASIWFCILQESRSILVELIMTLGVIRFLKEHT